MGTYSIGLQMETRISGLWSYDLMVIPVLDETCL